MRETNCEIKQNMFFLYTYTFMLDNIKKVQNEIACNYLVFFMTNDLHFQIDDFLNIHFTFRQQQKQNERILITLYYFFPF